MQAYKELDNLSLVTKAGYFVLFSMLLYVSVLNWSTVLSIQNFLHVSYLNL